MELVILDEYLYKFLHKHLRHSYSHQAETECRAFDNLLSTVDPEIHEDYYYHVSDGNIQMQNFSVLHWKIEALWFPLAIYPSHEP